MQEAVAYATVMVTLGLVLSRPRVGLDLRLSPAWAGLIGVSVLLMAGVVSIDDVAAAFGSLWRPSLTILSIMVTTNVARQFGILDHFARSLVPRAGQPVAGVFASVFAFSAATAATLNNDAAVLLLTPVVVALVRRSYPNRADLLVPFAFAVFSAAGVAPLVISNPMNLVVAEYAGIGFNDYAARMIPIALVGWITTYVILRLVFAWELRPEPVDRGFVSHEEARLPLRSKQFLVLLVVSLASYPALTYAGGPVWLVSTASALLAGLLCWGHRAASPVRLAAGLSWDILVFLFCVFIIVYGLRNVGLVGRISGLYLSSAGAAHQIVVIGISSALGSALLNNHPMAILNALAIGGLPGKTQQHVLAALVGGDLGPRLLPMGSLAGLLWLDSLRRLGVQITLSKFVFVGASLTLPALALSLIMLLLA